MKTVTMFIIALSIVAATSQVYAWEEQLRQCELRGIPPESVLMMKVLLVSL